MFQILELRGRWCLFISRERESNSERQKDAQSFCCADSAKIYTFLFNPGRFRGVFVSVAPLISKRLWRVLKEGWALYRLRQEWTLAAAFCASILNSCMRERVLSDLATEMEGSSFRAWFERDAAWGTAISRIRLVLLGGRSGQVWTLGGWKRIWEGGQNDAGRMIMDTWGHDLLMAEKKTIKDIKWIWWI